MVDKLLLYDGVCNLCNAGIQFVGKRDGARRIMFCSVQSQAAQPYLQRIGLNKEDVLRRFVFIENSDWSAASTAAARVAKQMDPPWPLLGSTVMAFPEPVRDAVYDFVAKHRYSLFGRTQKCQIPGLSLLERFVDRDELLSSGEQKEAGKKVN
ncbi:hypothetical protein DUNSADRAFT_16109 [Dunaliella salina]|uniref:Uncharacterized protein n=1 Tax=Dunaliella salina TaxID=3046 RepID=A0ABQ7G468_DUNSA|nr:hypothetical protein DUNSADRAFT_16109 [Dunaliella salina]|eukprot:KAF5829410.1 hypothetical protein DUNSADRAFT_16109 [Dunaliella salina]